MEVERSGGGEVDWKVVVGGAVFLDVWVGEELCIKWCMLRRKNKKSSSIQMGS